MVDPAITAFVEADAGVVAEEAEWATDCDGEEGPDGADEALGPFATTTL